MAAPAIEEILVTAQKRQQSLQDVPVAISAVLGDSMRDAGISKMDDLSGTVPSLNVSEAAGRDNLFVRGIGSGVNLGFEMAVGQVIDGFFYGRGRFSRAAFLDIERVEVLKGPQGAIIGKNTTAGVVNITTAQPTEGFEGWVSAGYEFEGRDGYNIEGAVSGPLSDSFMLRVAARVEDYDGYVDNVATGDDEADQQDHTARIMVLWAPNDSSEVTFSYQVGEFDRHGRSRQISHCGATLPVPADYDCKADYNTDVLGTRNGVGDIRDYLTEFDIAGLTIDWDAGENTITSLTGWSEYKVTDEFDSDQTPAELVNVSLFENYEQFSQELRIASPTGGQFEYLAGLYYLHYELDFDFRTNFNQTLPPPLRATRNWLFDVESDTYATFGQLTWNINDAWALTGSLRYTRESKDATHQQFPTALYTQMPIMVPGGPAAASHDIKDDRDENNLSPVVNLTWKPDDDSMYYLNIARGFKGGGFNGQAAGPDAVALATFQFEEEEVTAYELGAKLSFLDGSMQLNAALFRSEYDDLQVTSLGDDLTFNVGNASSAITEGLELDLKWRATEALTLNGIVTFLDSTFDDYTEAPCYHLQTMAQGCIGGVQDLSGKNTPYAPDLAATFNAEYVWQLSENLELTGFVQVVYSDDYLLQQDQDPLDMQGSFHKIDARLSLGDVEGRWKLSLVGRNLNDELTFSAANDLPTNGAPAGPPPNIRDDGHAAFVAPPRSIFVTARYNF